MNVLLSTLAFLCKRYPDSSISKLREETGKFKVLDIFWSIFSSCELDNNSVDADTTVQVDYTSALELEEVLLSQEKLSNLSDL